MNDYGKSKEELIAELNELRQQVSELKKNEVELQLFKAIVDYSNEAIAVSHPNGDLVYINHAHEKLFGRTLVEAQRCNYRDYYPPESVEILNREVDPALKRGESWEGVLDVFDADGNRFPLWERADTLFDDDGNLRYFFGVMHDVSQEIEMQAKLTESEEKYRLLFERMFEGIAFVEAVYNDDGDLCDARYLDINPAYENFIGFTKEDVVGKTVMEVMPNTEKEWFETFDSVVKTGVPIEFEMFHQDSNRHYLVKAYRPRKDTFAAIFEDITKQKQAEDALRESEAILQAAMDQSQAGIAIAEAPSGNLRYVNRAGLFIRGADEQTAVDEVISVEQYVPNWRILHLDGTPYRDDEVPLARAVLYGETCSKEFMIRRDDDEDRIVLANAAPILDQEGCVTAAVVVFLDITEQKKAENALRKSNEKYQLAMKATTDGLWDWNVKAGNVYYSPAWCHILGETDLEASYETWVDRIHPQDKKQTLKALQDHLTGKAEKFIHEHRLRMKNGDWVWVLGRGEVVEWDQHENPVRMVGTMSNITERKKAEEQIQYQNEEIQVQNEELRATNDQLVDTIRELEESEMRYRTLVDHATDALFFADLDGNLVDVNQEACISLGYTREELLSMNAFEVDLSANPAEDLALWRGLSMEESITVERMLRRKDGISFPVEIHATAVEWNEKKYILGLARNILERKRAERALRDSEERFRKIYESSQVGIARVGLDYKIMQANQAYCQMLGYTEDELTKKTLKDITYPEDIPENMEKQVKLGRGEIDSFRMEKRFIHRDGHTVWGVLHANLVRNDDAEPIYFIGLVSDITERKKAEKALQESGELFKTIFHQAAVGITQVAPDGTLMEVNQKFCDIIGYSKEELTQLTFKDITHPDDYHLDLKYIKRVVQGEIDKFTVDKRYIHKNGNVIWIKLYSAVVRDIAGVPLYAIAIIDDITKRKETEEQLRFQAQILEQIQDSILVTDLGGRITYVNHAETVLLKRSHGDLIGRTVHSLGEDSRRGAEQQEIIDTVLREGEWQGIVVNYAEDGSELIFNTRVWLFHDQTGAAKGMVGVSTNITERYYAERRIQAQNEEIQMQNEELRATNDELIKTMYRLRESESRYRTVAENFPNGALFLYDRDLRYTFVDGQALNAVGLKRDQLIGKTIYEIFPMSMCKIIEKHSLLAFQGRTTYYEVEYQGRLYENQVVPIIQEDGTIEEGLVYAQEITERKRMEDELHRSERRYRLLVDHSPLGIIAIDMEGNITHTNTKFIELMGSPSGKFTGSVNVFLFPLIVESGISDDFRECLETGRPVIAERRYTSYWGRNIYLRYHLVALRDGSDNIIGVQGVAEDVTAKHRAEEQLKASEEKYRLLAETAQDLICIHDMTGQITYLNQAALGFIGYDNETVLKKNVADFVHPEYIDDMQQRARLRKSKDEMTYIYETVLINMLGEQIPVEVSSAPIFEHGHVKHILIIARDITERKRAENQIKQALAEKTTLLRELYHRTKNNMQVISSMLGLQVQYINDEQVLKIFQDMENRIQSMALVHQKLYKSQNLSRIDLKEYISDLGRLLIRNYGTSVKRVNLIEEMESVYVLIDTAVPCGLIVNELITNALKYAFPNSDVGEIRITLSQDETGEIYLSLTDNGVGFPEGFDYRDSETLGMQLIHILSNQLRAEITLTSEGGVMCQLIFKDNLYYERVST